MSYSHNFQSRGMDLFKNGKQKQIKEKVQIKGENKRQVNRVINAHCITL